MKNHPPSDRTRVKRVPSRGAYDKETIYSILDEGLVCYVGFIENGRPVVIPTSYARAGDKLIIHGSRASRMMKALASGADVCVTVAHVDGIVVAKSATHHSVNYRSVVVFGNAKPVEGDEEIIEALRLLLEFTVPGRWDEVRPPSQKELSGTALIEIPLDEASAKIRTGPPEEAKEDLERAGWSGVIPLELTALPPLDDPRHPSQEKIPDHLIGYSRKSKR